MTITKSKSDKRQNTFTNQDLQVILSLMAERLAEVQDAIKQFDEILTAQTLALRSFFAMIGYEDEHEA